MPDVGAWAVLLETTLWTDVCRPNAECRCVNDITSSVAHTGKMLAILLLALAQSSNQAMLTIL